MSCPARTQCPLPGLKSGLLDPEVSALTMRPLCLHIMYMKPPLTTCYCHRTNFHHYNVYYHKVFYPVTPRCKENQFQMFLTCMINQFLIVLFHILHYFCKCNSNFSPKNFPVKLHLPIMQAREKNISQLQNPHATA